MEHTDITYTFIIFMKWDFESSLFNNWQCTKNSKELTSTGKCYIKSPAHSLLDSKM